jgi:LmbE family N-acetylglucosaminyl deacetylase
MLIAPHPDDESLACGVMLQQAVRAGAAVRVIYVTDGDNNPWPQRFLERKWHLNEIARKRWARLRRAEARAALRVLGVSPLHAHFLGWPDQGLTELLMRDCRSRQEHLATIIAEWAPTDLLLPSATDTHPDHNAVAVLVRLAMLTLGSPDISAWSYVVHGRNASFLKDAGQVQQTKTEIVRKKMAIRRHKTQLSLSQRRFLRYAARPEQLLKLEQLEKNLPPGPIHSISASDQSIHLSIGFRAKPFPSREGRLLLLGRDRSGAIRRAAMRLPNRPANIEILDYVNHQRLGVIQYNGNLAEAEIAVPNDIFWWEYPLFIKVERRSWFFNEMGWLEICPGAPRPDIRNRVAQKLMQ